MSKSEQLYNPRHNSPRFDLGPKTRFADGRNCSRLAPFSTPLMHNLGDAVDCTVYGTGKASPRDFLSHHTAALSSALVAADANNVLAAAAALDHRLVSGRHGE